MPVTVCHSHPIQEPSSNMTTSNSEVRAGAAPASGHFISVWRLSPREEVQALPVVGASHKHGVALCRADACPHALGSAPSAWDALVQRQAQKALCILDLAQDSAHSIGDQIDHLQHCPG